MKSLYTTKHESIVMKSEPRHMADTVSYMLAWEICEILDWNPEYVEQREKLNENFARIKLLHDWYEWHVLRWHLCECPYTNWDIPEEDRLIMSQGAIMIAAHEYLWTPYLRWGRMSTGIDCSWLTQQIYAKLGISLLRDSHEQAMQWIQVSYKDLQIWDLLFFENYKWSNHITHVAIYIEPWKILHVSEYWTADTRIDTLDERGIINIDGTIDNYFVSARRYK